MLTTLPIPTRRNGLFTTNRGDLEHPSLWDGLSLVYFPHDDGGGAKLKGYGELATDADLNGGYSWVESEIGRMVRFDGETGTYANTNNTAFVDKIDSDFSWHMWAQAETDLSNNERWWGSEDNTSAKPTVYAIVKSAPSGDNLPQISTVMEGADDDEFVSKTNDVAVDMDTRPISFSCSIDWSDAAAGSPTSAAGVLSLGGAITPDTQPGGSLGVMDACDEPIYIGARRFNGALSKEIKCRFSTIAWWTRLLSTGEQRLLGTDPFVLCRRRSS